MYVTVSFPAGADTLRWTLGASVPGTFGTFYPGEAPVDAAATERTFLFLVDEARSVVLDVRTSAGGTTLATGQLSTALVERETTEETLQLTP